jgi:hypothetical protein
MERTCFRLPILKETRNNDAIKYHDAFRWIIAVAWLDQLGVQHPPHRHRLLRITTYNQQRFERQEQRRG